MSYAGFCEQCGVPFYESERLNHKHADVTPKTQSVCKHCDLPIERCGNRWISSGMFRCWGNEMEHCHEPVSTYPKCTRPKPAPQTSAEPKKQCGCVHGDSDPYCPDPLCPNYIAAYHVKPAAPQPVSGGAPSYMTCTECGMNVCDHIVKRLAGDAPKEEIAKEIIALDSITYIKAGVINDIAAILRHYFPPASQTPRNADQHGYCLNPDNTPKTDCKLCYPALCKCGRPEFHIGACLATPASTARTDGWVSVEKLPKPLVAEFQGRFSETLELFDDANNYWLGFYDFKDGKWWIHQGYEDDAEVLEIYKIKHWRELPAAPGSVHQAEPPKEEK